MKRWAAAEGSNAHARPKQLQEATRPLTSRDGSLVPGISEFCENEFCCRTLHNQMFKDKAVSYVTGV